MNIINAIATPWQKSEKPQRIAAIWLSSESSHAA
jgi:hypothetical protein